MKVLGISCGRKNGNSEILLKEALMALQEASGAETEIIRIHDLNVKPCTGCEGCIKNMLKGGDSSCVVNKDDIPFLVEKLTESNGFIVSAPIYDLMPPGYLTMISNKFLSCGIAYRKHTAENPKLGAMITLGGTDWTNLGLPLTWLSLKQFAANNLILVDQMLVQFAPACGSVLLKEKAIERAHKLGLNFAEALKLPPDKDKYMGDTEEACPLCHSNLLQLRGDSVVCALCDCEGKIEFKDGRYQVVYTEEALGKSRWSEWGERVHMEGIIKGHQEYAANQEKAKIASEKYKAFGNYIKP